MDSAERVSVRTFVFTLESATETQVARIHCDDSRWDLLGDQERLQLAIKAVRQTRPFDKWRIVHVYVEGGLPTL